MSKKLKDYELKSIPIHYRSWLVLVFVIIFGFLAYQQLKPSQAINANIDGIGGVDSADLAILVSNFGRQGMTFGQGDITGDGRVDGFDGSALLANWGGGTPPVNGIIVSPTGNDSTGNGTVSNPYKTMSRAQTAATPGSTVYLRGGVYNMSLILLKSGTASAPITYSSYPSETAILDGGSAGLGSGGSIIDVGDNTTPVSYIKVENFEFRNSGGRAISFKNATHSSIKNSKMHNTQYKAISAAGDDILIEGNEVWDATMVNANNAIGGTAGWPQATGSIARPSGYGRSTNIVFRNNYIHDSWGEGIDLINTDGGTIEGNKVINCYSVLIYTDGSKGVNSSNPLKIINNYVAVTDSKYNRNSNGNPASGISIATETSTGSTDITDFIIANNVIAGGTNKGIGYSQYSGRTYGNIKIYYNTIRGTKAAGINFDSVGTPTGVNEIKNNIVYAGGGGSLSNGNISSWTIDHNDWPNGIPSGANGIGTLSSDPQFVNPNAGATSPAEEFKVSSSSPVIGKATPVSITTDYFGSTRSSSTPTMGFFESTSNNSPPASAGYFTLQPVGAWTTLPSGSQCSTQVHRSTWEPRPDNTKRNHIMPNATSVHNTFTAKQRSIDGTYDPKWDSWLLARVDGQFTGTTDEIFQWAACKWGLPDNYLRAEANQESTWYQYLTYPSGRCVEFYGCGDRFSGPSTASGVFCNGIAQFGYDYQRDWGTNLCPQTFSIMGIKSWWDPGWGFNWTDNQNGTFPYNRDSTAFAVDYMASQIRGCYEGWEIWLRDVDPIDHQYAAGDLMACAGVWFSGNWYDAAGQSYANSVQNFMNTKPWLVSGFANDKPGCNTFGCPGPDPL